MSSIAALDHRLALRTLGIDRDQLPFRKAAQRVDLALILGLGIATAILTVSGALAVWLERYRVPTNAFFFGLIVALALVLYGEVSLKKPRRWLAAVLAVGLAFWLTGGP